MYYEQPPAVVRFDSSQVARNRHFGYGVQSARQFVPEQADWDAFRELIEAEEAAALENRFLAYRFEDQAAGLLTDADLITATGAC